MDPQPHPLLHFLLDEHTLPFAHLQSKKETIVWTYVFSLCIPPTLQMAVSIRNKCCQLLRVMCFMAGVRFHLTAPHIYILFESRT